MKILYDGWPLAFQPNSPAATHLLTLLEAHPHEIAARVALPAASFHTLPDWLETEISPSPDTEPGRLRWEQSLLPNLARRCEADWIHTTGANLSLFGSTPGLISPTNSAGSSPEFAGNPGKAPERRGFAARLREALSQGGQTRARALLWPADLPIPASGPRLHRLPPVVHPVFHPAQSEAALSDLAAAELARLDLPETFVLYHGPLEDAALRGLLDAWSWAAGPIGEYYPLVLAGCTREAQEHLAALLAEYGLTGTARPLPPLAMPALAEIYRRSAAVFHPLEISPWAGPLRLGLACARPVIGPESERAAALVGPAAYLARPGESYADSRRALGAALLTVIVEEGLADHLVEAARLQSESWDIEPFRIALEKFYKSLG